MRNMLPMLVLAAVLASVNGAAAQLTQRAIDTALVQIVLPGMTLQVYLDRRRIEFRRMDTDGDGAITAADQELDRAGASAGNRAMFVKNILQFDLDGDGVVTRAEVADAFDAKLAMMPVDRSRPDFKQQFDAQVARQMLADSNGDGRIDGPEMLAFARQTASAGPAYTNGMIAAALSFDDDGDGKTTEAELLKGAESFFRRIDTDGDGTISGEESQAFRRSIQGTRT
jgi:Ca2+-binding EF-hand superfamily protein